jgi:hypothetical protein
MWTYLNLSNAERNIWAQEETRCEVVTAVTMKEAVFRDVVSYTYIMFTIVSEKCFVFLFKAKE